MQLLYNFGAMWTPFREHLGAILDLNFNTFFEQMSGCIFLDFGPELGGKIQFGIIVIMFWHHFCTIVGSFESPGGSCWRPGDSKSELRETFSNFKFQGDFLDAFWVHVGLILEP